MRFGLAAEVFCAEVALPSAEELRKFIENDREAIESSMREPGSALETDP